MLCTKCGAENNANERFCRNCGNLIAEQQFQNNQQFGGQQVNNNYNQQNMNQSQTNYNQQQTTNYGQQTANNNQQTYMNNQNGNLDSNYVQNAVNQNMKKWAILSIVVAVAGLVWYWFIGLSFYLAILIAAAGFGFAQKGEMADKKLAIVGEVANGILVGMAIVMFILQLIGAFAS